MSPGPGQADLRVQCGVTGDPSVCHSRLPKGPRLSRRPPPTMHRKALWILGAPLAGLTSGGVTSSGLARGTWGPLTGHPQDDLCKLVKSSPAPNNELCHRYAHTNQAIMCRGGQLVPALIKVLSLVGGPLTWMQVGGCGSSSEIIEKLA